jgi:soluble lytic murein transglycosylase-like protein
MKQRLAINSTFRQLFCVALWILCMTTAVAAYGSTGNEKQETGDVITDDPFPTFDLDTENFAKYPHPEFSADRTPALSPIDWSFLSARRKAAKAAEEPAWLQALRARNGYMDLYLGASKKYNVPVLLLLAISEQESGHHPWALNIAGQGFKPKSKEDALRVLHENYKNSYDVGLMQVNSFWIRRLNLRVEDVFEPPVNITIAAYILDECFRVYGTDWKALGAYHHPPNKNTARSLNYAKVVWSRYLKLESWKNRFKEKETE